MKSLYHCQVYFPKETTEYNKYPLKAGCVTRLRISEDVGSTSIEIMLILGLIGWVGVVLKKKYHSQSVIPCQISANKKSVDKIKCQKG